MIPPLSEIGELVGDYYRRKAQQRARRSARREALCDALVEGACLVITVVGVYALLRALRG